MLTMKTIMSQVQGGDWLVTIDLKDAIFTSRSFGDTGGSFSLPLEGRLPIQGPALRPGLGAENVYEMHGCCTGPFEAPGHSCTELSDWLILAHSWELVSRHRDIVLCHIHSLGLRMNAKKSVLLPSQ